MNIELESKYTVERALRIEDLLDKRDKTLVLRGVIPSKSKYTNFQDYSIKNDTWLYQLYKRRCEMVDLDYVYRALWYELVKCDEYRQAQIKAKNDRLTISK